MFGTSGIRGEFGTDVNAGVALDLGRAIASEDAGRVVVGRDVRTTGALLTDAVTAGLRECGTDVVSIGVVPTPTVARAVAWYDADVGVAVTASHNPPTDNGLKLWDRDGSAIVDGRQAVVANRMRADRYEYAQWDQVGTRTTRSDALDRHVDAVADAVDTPEDGALDVVVDVGNGTGTVTATVLRELGHTVRTLNADADGGFPARPSEPTAETCRDLCAVVEATDAALGIAHDGDADRMMAVTEDGEFVPGDVLLALFGTAALSPGQTVAVPVDTSLAVERAVRDAGGETTYTRVGDGYVAERTADDGVVFGGEPSGAWIWPSHARCPDGTLAAAKLASLVADAGSFADLVASVERTPLRRESVETDAKHAVVASVHDHVEETYDDVTALDGVRVDVADGWFLVRASGTEPLVRVTAEAESPDRMHELHDIARDLVDAAQSATP